MKVRGFHPEQFHQNCLVKKNIKNRDTKYTKRFMYLKLFKMFSILHSKFIK